MPHRSEPPAPPSAPVDADAAVALVDTYLAHCQARRLDEATAMLVDQPLVVFPGGVVHADLHAMVADAAGRYQRVAKTRQRATIGTDDRGRQVVTHSGVLDGVNTAGVPFGDVRYLDLFVLEGDRIAEQHVFNDLAVGDVLTRDAPTQ